MFVTVNKTYNGRIAVSATQKVTTLEDLVLFATKFGYIQPLEEFVEDFQNHRDIVYRTELVNEFH